jgi:hypothetical protein
LAISTTRYFFWKMNGRPERRSYAPGVHLAFLVCRGIKSLFRSIERLWICLSHWAITPGLFKRASRYGARISGRDNFRKPMHWRIVPVDTPGIDQIRYAALPWQFRQPALVYPVKATKL